MANDLTCVLSEIELNLIALRGLSDRMAPLNLLCWVVYSGAHEQLAWRRASRDTRSAPCERRPANGNRALLIQR